MFAKYDMSHERVFPWFKDVKNGDQVMKMSWKVEDRLRTNDNTLRVSAIISQDWRITI